MCSEKNNHKLQFTVAALQILTIEYVDPPQQQHKSENAKGQKVVLSCDIQHGGVRVKKEKRGEQGGKNGLGQTARVKRLPSRLNGLYH